MIFTFHAPDVSNHLEAPPMSRRPPSRSLRPAYRPVFTVVLAVLALLALAGCRLRGRDEYEDDGDDGGTEELSTAEQEVVDDGAEVEATVRGDSGLALLPTFAFIARKEPLTLARAVQLQGLASLLFFPSGCATVTTSGNVVTYTFDSTAEPCNGPLGLVDISGTETVTFRPGSESGAIEMSMVGSGLMLGRRAIEHEAVAELTISDTGRRLTYAGTFAGTTPRGLPVSHASDLTIVTDDPSGCATVDGTTSGTVGPRRLDVTFGQFTRCGPVTNCPSGTVSSTARLKQITVSVAFDGSDTATVTTPRGGEIDVDLECVPR